MVTPALAIVPKSPPCTCRKCMCSGGRECLEKRTFRELVMRSDADEDLVAVRWHEYLDAMRAVKIPSRLRDRLREPARPTPGTAIVREFAQCSGAFKHDGTSAIVFAGPTGTGKSFAMAWGCLYAFAAHDEQPPLFITATELERIPSYGDGSERYDDLLKRWTIAIDELGTEPTSKRHTARINEIVDTAYQRESILMITTNLSAKQFAKRYGARVFDRLREFGVWTPCLGPSMRITPAERRALEETEEP